MKSSTNDTAKLAAAVSIQRLAESAGVVLKRKGNALVGSCPFHSSKSTTLVLTPKQNTWSCTGKCRVKNGTVIEWVMRAEGVSKKHAIELLRTDFEPATSVKPITRSTSKKIAAFEAGQSDASLLVSIAGYYHERLQQSRTALEYLRRQRLAKREMIEHFKLGFCDRSLGYRLPDRNRKSGLALREQLQRLGIQRSTGHEHFRGCITIPVGERNDVANIYGHRIGPSQRGEPTELWLTGKATDGIFNVAGVQGPNVIVCSSMFDALTVWSAGFGSVTACFDLEHGLGQFVEVFKQREIERVLLAFPRTNEFDAQADSAAGHFATEGLSVFRVVFPAGIGPHEHSLLSTDEPTKSLEVLIRNAVWVKGVRAVQPQATEAAAAVATDARPAAEHEVNLRFGERRWRIRGLDRNTVYERLHVNVLIGLHDGQTGGDGIGAFHVDAFDLYSARHRAVFTRQAALELGCDERAVKNDLGKVLLDLEHRQDTLIKSLQSAKPQAAQMTPAERDEAMSLLRDPALLDRIGQDLGRFVVGEDDNKLIAYLAATSRLLDAPLAVVVQSSSSAGKSTLMQAVLDLMPEEEREVYSAVTGQSLFYVGQQDLAHKILAVSEEEGAREASYALKVLQSEGRLVIASTGKDAATGRLVTQQYRVDGPVMLFLTTTSSTVDEELTNRCIVLAVDEGIEQTKAIHRLQRRRQTLAGLLSEHGQHGVQRLHRNAQRLLQRLHVVNPFADELEFGSGQLRARRDHAKFLGLINVLALLHQYQRTIKEVEHDGARLRYVEATREDIAIATRLCKNLFISTAEDVSLHTLRVLEGIGELAAEVGKRQALEPSKVKLTRRQIRQRMGIGQTQIRVHLQRLVELEYVAAHGGSSRGQVLYSYVADLAGWRGAGGGVAAPMARQVGASDSDGLPSRGGISDEARRGKGGRSPSYPQASSASE